MAGIRIEGNSSGNVAEVDSSNQLKVTPAVATTLAGVSQPQLVGMVRTTSENDPGTITGAAYLISQETTDDAKGRVTLERVHDNEVFNYAAQNTGKHKYANTTMTNAWTASGFQTNSGSITTTTTGTSFSTWAEFPATLGAHAIYCEVEMAISAAPPTNTTVDFGLFRPAAANPYAPADGVYFRITSSGIRGVLNNNGTETPTGVMIAGGSMPLNTKRQFIISANEREVEFWIDAVLYARIATPSGQGVPWMSATLPFSVRHAIAGGAASGAFQLLVTNYTVSQDNPGVATSLGDLGNIVYGAHQGLSGGTMGSLATYANSTTPAGVAGSNTAAAATGLGGQVTLNAAAAAATDFILTSYQVPAGTTAIQGRRLVLNGVRISAANLGAAVATTETTLAFSLAFGHSAVSLATTEAAAAKAPRRVALGIMSWAIGAAIGAGPREGSIFMPFASPIVVNPGEFIASVGKFLQGTATASQTIYIQVTFDYGWI